MGAEEFWHKEVGVTPEEAFHKAVESAAYEHGHGGYTGTIAEKSDFVMIEVPKIYTAMDYIDKLMGEEDPRVANKWGPAGCVCLGPSKKDPKMKVYMFFGIASS